MEATLEERQNEGQLTQDRANIKTKTKIKAKKPKSSIHKNPILKLFLPFLVEVSPLGLLPSWTIFVIYTYREEKKAGNPINIPEYMIVGTLAAFADVIDLLSLTGIGIIIAIAIDFPVLGLLWL